MHESLVSEIHVPCYGKGSRKSLVGGAEVFEAGRSGQSLPGACDHRVDDGPP